MKDLDLSYSPGLPLTDCYNIIFSQSSILLLTIFPKFSLIEDIWSQGAQRYTHTIHSSYLEIYSSRSNIFFKSWSIPNFSFHNLWCGSFFAPFKSLHVKVGIIFFFIFYLFMFINIAYDWLPLIRWDFESLFN